MAFDPNTIEWHRLDKTVSDYYRVPDLRNYLKAFLINDGKAPVGIGKMTRETLIQNLSTYCDSVEITPNTIPDNKNKMSPKPYPTTKAKEAPSLEASFTLPDDIEEKTVTTRRGERSYNGHNLGELISWLQKSIRRGNIEDSVWAMTEIITMPKREIVSNLFNRLRIISLEDIGVADPHIVIDIDHVLSQLTVPDTGLKRRPNLPIVEGDIQLIANMVRKMALSEHIRSASDFNAVYLKPDEVLEILFDRFSELYTQDTRAVYEDSKLISDSVHELAMKMKMKVEKGDYNGGFYLKRLLMLADDGVVSDVKCYKSGKLRYFILSELISIARKIGILNVDKYENILVQWYKQGLDMMKENNLPLIFMMLMILIKVNNSNPDKEHKSADGGQQPVVVVNFKEDRIVPVIPDYAIDKHTTKGKRQGKTGIDFVLEGALVVNEPKHLLNNIMRKIYIESKLVEIGHVIPDEDQSIQDTRDSLSSTSGEIKLSEGELSEGNLSKGELSESELSEGELSKGELSEENLSKRIRFSTYRLNPETVAKIKSWGHGQKMTAKWKAYTYMGKRYVAKGPYHLDNKGEYGRLNKMWTRLQMHLVTNVPCLRLHFVKERDDDNNVWVISEQLAMKFDGFEDDIVDRETAGVTQCSKLSQTIWTRGRPGRDREIIS